MLYQTTKHYMNTIQETEKAIAKVNARKEPSEGVDKFFAKVKQQIVSDNLYPVGSYRSKAQAEEYAELCLDNYHENLFS